MSKRKQRHKQRRKAEQHSTSDKYPAGTTSGKGAYDEVSYLSPPLAIFSALVLLMVAALILLQVVEQKDMHPIYKVNHLAGDYSIIYQRSLSLFDESAAGLYESRAPVYPFPPTVALLNIPLTYVEVETARVIIVWAVYLSVVFAMLLMHRCFNGQAQIKRCRIYGVVRCSRQHSVMHSCFLFDRGNMDGFAFLFSCLVIYLIVAPFSTPPPPPHPKIKSYHGFPPGIAGRAMLGNCHLFQSLSGIARPLGC